MVIQTRRSGRNFPCIAGVAVKKKKKLQESDSENIETEAKCEDEITEEEMQRMQ